MTQDTLERVSRRIAKYLDIPVEKVTPEATLEGLGLDSLGSLELIFELEEEFKIVVPNERASDFTTVQAVCDGIETLLKTTAGASAS
jgi:acyl carrier protein